MEISVTVQVGVVPFEGVGSAIVSVVVVGVKNELIFGKYLVKDNGRRERFKI